MNNSIKILLFYYYLLYSITSQNAISHAFFLQNSSFIFEIFFKGKLCKLFEVRINLDSIKENFYVREKEKIIKEVPGCLDHAILCCSEYVKILEPCNCKTSYLATLIPKRIATNKGEAEAIINYLSNVQKMENLLELREELMEYVNEIKKWHTY